MHKKHLIAETNEYNRMVIKKLLETLNEDVDDVKSGNKVIELVKEDVHKYYIIWLDINMPIMDGLECAKILKDELNYKGHIIGITGNLNPDIIEECYKMGISDVVSKPVTQESLKKYINKYTPKINIL
jgi:CheY-like chemotaxis protein